MPFFFGIPDIRLDVFYPGFEFTVPQKAKKDYILHPEKFEPRDFLINKFLAKPDWKDPHEKLLYITILGAKFGSFFGLTEILAKNISVKKLALQRFAMTSGFITSGFLTYGCVTHLTACVRGNKDDWINHFIGGGSVGFLFGYLYRSSAQGCLHGLAFACIATWVKQFNKRGDYIFHPDYDILRENNSIYGGKEFDFRLWEDKKVKERKTHYVLGV